MTPWRPSAIARPARSLTSTVFLLSAALAGDAIHVDRTADAVIVRSGADEANFLFRAPADFTSREAEKPFLVALAAEREGRPGSIRLRIGPVRPADARRPATDLARAAEAEYTGGRKAPFSVAGTGARAVAKVGALTVLLVRDGDRLYELFCEGGTAFGEDFTSLVDGFTILSPKGTSIAAAASPEESKAKTLSHDYFKLSLLKPEGFKQKSVDPNREPGIWISLRAEDEERNLCLIKVRVYLSRTLKQSIEARAAAAIRRFADKYPSARVPKRPKKFRSAGAEDAYRFKASGKLAKSGVVLQREARFIRHRNGRLYEIELTTYAGAARAFRKQISAFWKSIRIKAPK